VTNGKEGKSKYKYVKEKEKKSFEQKRVNISLCPIKSHTLITYEVMEGVLHIH